MSCLAFTQGARYAEVLSSEHLWHDDVAIAAIDQTYEIDADLEIWNYRALRVIEELREQTEMFSCNGAVYTQTTDVEGEVNGASEF